MGDAYHCDQAGNIERGIRCTSLGSQSSKNKDLISRQISVGWRWEMFQVRLFLSSVLPGKNIPAAGILWDTFNDAMAAGHLPPTFNTWPHPAFCLSKARSLCNNKKIAYFKVLQLSDCLIPLALSSYCPLALLLHLTLKEISTLWVPKEYWRTGKWLSGLSVGRESCVENQYHFNSSHLAIWTHHKICPTDAKTENINQHSLKN